MTDLADRLQRIKDSDHERGCMGRQYSCTCGYDDRKDALLVEAAAAMALPVASTLSQHIGWLKQFIQGMDETNWQDMRLRAERQLDELAVGFAQQPRSCPQWPGTEPCVWPECDCPGGKHAQGASGNFTPKQFVDDILSACDPSNWDSERNKGARYRGLHDAYTDIHEIANEYQEAMYAWTKSGPRIPAASEDMPDWERLGLFIANLDGDYDHWETAIAILQKFDVRPK